MRLRATVIPLILVFCFWGGVKVHAAGDFFEQMSLIGLKKMQVVVEDLPSDASHDGLSHTYIKSLVEQRLQEEGVTVDQQAEHALYVYLAATKDETGRYSYALSLDVQQLVRLYRDPSLVTWASTWRFAQIGTVAQTAILDLYPVITKGVDAFLGDYWTANPRVEG